MTVRVTVLAAVLAGHAALGAPAVHAQGLPSMSDSAVFLAVVADRGAACELLVDWEAAAVRAEARRAIERFEGPERADIRADVARRAGDTACDDDAMTAWIEAARPGVEREYLPHFLAAYRALAMMESPPSVFLAAAPRHDYYEAVTAIDDKIAALDAAGVRAEGGVEWDKFMSRTGEAVAAMAGTLVSGEGDWQGATPDQAAAYMVDAGVVTELWLAAEGEALD
jgi:hypothetical protein